VSIHHDAVTPLFPPPSALDFGPAAPPSTTATRPPTRAGDLWGFFSFSHGPSGELLNALNAVPVYETPHSGAYAGHPTAMER